MTQLVLYSSISVKIAVSVFLPNLRLLLSVFLAESYSSFLVCSSPHLRLPSLCSSLPLNPSLLIFKSHMLPARLAQLHPANERLFIGLRLSAAKQGLVIGLRLGPASQFPIPPSWIYSPLHMLVLVWPCRPEGDYLSVLPLIADSSRKEPEKEGERERERERERKNSVGLFGCYLTRLYWKVCFLALKS